MTKIPVLALPYPSTGLVEEPVLSFSDGALRVAMNFDDEGDTKKTELVFARRRSFRSRAEIHCSEWHVKDCYDVVCEVVESDWVQELRHSTVPDLRDEWVMRHFILYIDSTGCIEIICENAELRQGEA